MLYQKGKPVKCWISRDQLERRRPAENEFQGRLRKRIAELACEYGRYGYRRITALLQAEGWKVNYKRARKDMAAGGLKGSKEAAEKKKAVV